MGFSVSGQPSYMYQCPSGYIFRLRIPTDLRELVGKCEFRYSLRSGTLRVAKHRARCIVFSYRDRKNNNEKKTMHLDAEEFIRRFLLHVLPKGFMKIRYFGFLSNINKKKCIQKIRQLLESKEGTIEQIKETVQEIMQRVTGVDITCCPKCKKGKMITIKELPKMLRDTS